MPRPSSRSSSPVNVSMTQDNIPVLGKIGRFVMLQELTRLSEPGKPIREDTSVFRMFTIDVVIVYPKHAVRCD